MGQRFQYRRDSNFIDGVRHDAVPRRHIAARAHHRSPAAAGPASAAEPRGPRTMEQPASRHDVIVVGARAAGAATAMLLARSGLDVLVLDRGRYGADTLSTHALMRGGVVQLHRWGLLDAVVAAGTPRCGAPTSPTPTRR